MDEGLAYVGLRPFAQCATDLRLDDVPLPLAMIGRVRPKPYATLTVRFIPRGKGILRTVLIGIAMIAISIFVPPLGAALAPVGWSAMAASALGAGLAAVASVGVALAINALIPLRPPKLALASQATQQGGGSVEQSPTFALSDARNQASPWGPVPVHFGVHRFTPPYGAMPYTEIVGTDQYLRLLFVVGYGPCHLDAPMIGETPLIQFQNIEYEVHQGYWGDPPLRLYPGTVKETPLSVALTASAGWQQRTVETDADEISIDITFPQGLGQFNQQNGKLEGFQVRLQMEYRVSPSGAWLALDSRIEGQQLWASELTGSALAGERKGRVWVTTAGRLELREGDAAAVGQAAYPGVGSQVPLYRYTVRNTGLAQTIHVWDQTLPLPTVAEDRVRHARLVLARSGQVQLLTAEPEAEAPPDLPNGVFPLYRLVVGWAPAAGSDVEHEGSTFWPPFADPPDEGGAWLRIFRLSLTAAGDFELHVRPAPLFARGGAPASSDALPLDDFPPRPDGSRPLYRGVVTDRGLLRLVDERGPETVGFDLIPGGPGNQVQLSRGRSAHRGLARVIRELVDERVGVTGFDLIADSAGPELHVGAGTFLSQTRTSGFTEFTDERQGVTGFGASTSGLQITLAAGTFPSSDTLFDHATNAALRRTLTRVVPRAVYDIRVVRITGDTNDTTHIDKCFWTAIRGFKWANPITFPVPLCVIALRIRASDQLNGVLDTFSTLVAPADTIYGHRNPASAFRLALQGPANAKPLPASRIDVASLDSWAAYCDSRGWAFDMPRDFRASLWDTLQDIAAAGRATIRLTTDGRWGVVVDELGVGAPVVQHFTPRNSWGYESTKTFRELPHGWRVRILNAAENWRQDERYVFRDGYSEANASLYEQLELPGVTDAQTAWRHGRMFFAQAELRPEEYSFSCDWEHLVCQRGDRIAVEHDVPLWGLAGGRVTGVYHVGGEGYVTLDETVAMEPGKQYVVRFRASDGTSVLNTVETVPAETQTLHITGGTNYPVAVGDLFQFGESGRESVRLVVKRIEPGPDFSARLTCVDEAPGIHTADQGPIAPWDPHITRPIDWRQLPPHPPKFVSINSSDFTSYQVQADGSIVRSILVTLAVDAPPDVGPGIAYYEGLWREVHATEYHYGTVGLAGFARLAPVQAGEVYELIARTVSVYGLASAWVVAYHTVAASILIPGPVHDFRVYSVQQTITAEWVPPTNLPFGIRAYWLVVSLTPNYGDGTVYDEGLTTMVSHGPFPLGTTVWCWIVAVSTLGDVGAFTPEQSAPGLSAVIAGVTANQSANGHFEQGNIGWTMGGWEIIQDIIKARDGSWLARQTAPGQSLGYTTAVAIVAQPWVGAFAWFATDAGTDGHATVAIQFLGSDQQPIPGTSLFYGSVVFPRPPDENGLVWQESTLLLQAPYEAFYYRVWLTTSTTTTGRWYADSVYGDSGAKPDILLARYGQISTTNNLVNGHFELGDVLWDKDVGWVIDGRYPEHVHGGVWGAAHLSGDAAGQYRRVTCQDLIEVFAGQSFTFTAWVKTLDAPNGTWRMGVTWGNSLLQQIGELASEPITNPGGAYLWQGGTVRVPFNTAYCRIWIETFGHTSGTWIIDDAVVSVAENETGELPAIGTQYPGQVRTGPFIAESLIATTVRLTSANPGEYITPQGMIHVNVPSLGTAVVQMRRSHPAGAVVGATTLTNLSNSTIQTHVSLSGVDGGPPWDDVYVLTVFGVADVGGAPTVQAVTILPGSTLAMVHMPVGSAFGSQVFTAPTVFTGPFTGETVIAASPAINPAVQEGILIPQAWLNLTVAATSTVLLQVRRTNVSGTPVGAALLVNPLASSVSVRVDATGLELNPLWGGQYVLTVLSLHATTGTNAVTVNAGGGFRLVHRRTGAAPAILDVFTYSGNVVTGTFTGTFAQDAWIATAPGVAVAAQIGYLQAAGVVTLTLPPQTMTRLSVRRHDLNGQIIGSVILTNGYTSSITIPVAVQGYDPEPRWGDTYTLTLLCITLSQVPTIVGVQPGGTFAMLHTRLS